MTIINFQRKLCLKLFLLIMICIPFSWVTILSLISDTLDKLNFHINGYYLWLSYLPMIFIFAGYLRDKPIVFDWAVFYSIAIPFSLFSLTYSLINIYVFAPRPINYILTISLLIFYVAIFFFKAKKINFKLIKKNLLKFHISHHGGYYSPRPKNGDIDRLYMSATVNPKFDKIKSIFLRAMLIVGPLLVGANISSANNGSVKIILTSVFIFFTSIIVGIYLFHLYYARLKCLYEIQKDLGCKLRFGE